jgi:hypothetical protein
MMDEATFQEQLAHHEAWLQTGRALLATADLIWPEVRAGFDRMASISAALKAAHAARQVPDAQEVGGTVLFPPTYIERLIEFNGYCNAYLLNAGYGIENILKAVRIKRLVLAGREVHFGGGDHQIPRGHTATVRLATVELDKLSDDETFLLKRLALFVQWAGRYPVPIEPRPIDEVNGRGIGSQDHEKIHVFCQRVIDKYEQM